MQIPIRNNGMPEQRLGITYRIISDLKPDPKNPRGHNQRQIKLLARSIKEVGFNVPILVDRADTVIAGHARLQAAKLLGLKDVPTICLDHLTEAQARIFMIADNRLCEIATWDDQLLGEQLQVLSDMNLDFSLEITGFTIGEIDLCIEGLNSKEKPKDDPADILPAPENSPAVTKPGDLWLLGKHRLYCGNALEGASYIALMGEARASMVFADPPYNVAVEGHVSGLGAIKHREFAMATGEMDEAAFTAFLTRACSLLAQYSTDGSLHFICMDWRHATELLDAGKRTYSEFKNMCVWVKDNAGMGSLYRSQHELVFVFKHGSASHHNNIQLGKYGRHRSNVWKYPGINSFSRKTEEGNLLELHPTVKPTVLVADAILDCSARGDIVLDSFLGSGTTLMAAERVGRICHGMELDPLYVDTAIRRWQAYTGDYARHAVTGQMFNEIELKKE